MSLLKDYSELKTVVENISYLTDNETDDFITSIYNYILYNYGEKTVSPLVTSGLTAQTIATVINNKYNVLWDKLKSMNDTDVSLTDYKRTEQTDNKIYGFNSDSGVSDYTLIKTYTDSYSDIYENYKKALAFFANSNYYSIVASCIVNELTTAIYESEDY